MKLSYLPRTAFFCEGVHFSRGSQDVSEANLAKLMRNPFFNFRVRKGDILIENFDDLKEKYVPSVSKDSQSEQIKLEAIRNAHDEKTVKQLVAKETSEQLLSEASKKIDALNESERQLKEKKSSLKKAKDAAQKDEFKRGIRTKMTTEEILAALFLIAPQFQTTDPVELARLNSLIDLLKCTICPNDFGRCYALAFAYYLAHLLLINQNAGTIGLATSLSEGGLSISYGTNGNNDGGLNSTVFGRQFLALRGTGRSKAFVVGGGLCGIYPYFIPNMGSGYPKPGCC